MFATKMVEVCKYGRYIFTLVLFSKLIEEGQKQERNILAVEKSSFYMVFLSPCLSSLTCLRRSLVFLHMLSIAIFRVLLLSFFPACKREKKNGISNGIRLLFIT